MDVLESCSDGCGACGIGFAYHCALLSSSTFLILIDRAIDAIAKTKFIDQGNYMVVLLEGHLDLAHTRLYLN
jgi:hypothetical protein